jgi:hypothetical protein
MNEKQCGGTDDGLDFMVHTYFAYSLLSKLIYKNDWNTKPKISKQS